ncbi:polysaccharide lyase family protein [Viscerimonas tarda]
MKFFGQIKMLGVALCGLFLLASSPKPCFSQTKVTLTESNELYTLDNGLVTAKIAKVSGDLVSFRYKGLEMLATFLTPEGEPDLEKDPPGANPNGLNRGMTDHQYGFWSHDAMGPRGTAPTITRITIDPSKNGGERAEVSVKGIAKGRKMGTGPGASADGQFAADVELRYTLGKGDQGIYTYSIFEHQPDYPYTQLGEARFCAKLADFFDWLSVDEQRNKYFPKELKEGDKYVYTALQSINPAFGWSSTTKNVGLFFINPSMEYMSGGPTKWEFMGHRDTNPVAAPCVLNYWRSSHYGGAEINVAAGEQWTKVVGPFLIYVNAGENPQAIYNDAKARAAEEAGKWPFEWVKGTDYPNAKERVAVKGQLVLNDGDNKSFSNLSVGLTHAAYVSARPERSPEAVTNWQRDAKHYQFWTKGRTDGTFEISNVRPGKYTFYAFADGILGEFLSENVTVEAGKPLDLGKLTWTPVRYGKQVWDIGIPNRNASEFFKAEEFSNPEISLQYGLLFPNDITYTIGKSNFAKDWFFQHVPHNDDPNAKPVPFRGASAPGKASPYSIVFDMPSAAKGKATLRFAICGTGVRSVDIAVNGQPAGKLENLPGDGTITRHGRQGIWYERAVSFDASLIKKGSNTLVLTVPEGPVNNGIMYDYIRLELAD